jgi:hypothetical protein
VVTIAAHLNSRRQEVTIPGEACKIHSAASQQQKSETGVVSDPTTSDRPDSGRRIEIV